MSHKVAPRSGPHRWLLVLASLWLSACDVAGSAPGQAAGDAAGPTTVAPRPIAAAPAARPLGAGRDLDGEMISYRCANGERLQVAYRRADAAMISYRGETHFLPLARSASGARYAGDGWQWWIKGQEEGVLSRLPPGVALAPGAGVICRVEHASPQGTLSRPVAGVAK